MNDEKELQLDLHGFKLFEARMELCEDVLEAAEDGYESVHVIHGFNRGHVIKDYLRGRDGFLNDLRRRYPECPHIRLKPSGEGSTMITFQRKETNA